MPIPVGYRQLSSGFWIKDDCSGPYFVDTTLGVAYPMGGSVISVSSDNIAKPLTGTLTETVLATISVGPPPTLNAGLVIDTQWSFTGATQAKNVVIRLNGTQFQNASIAAGQASARQNTIIRSRNSRTSQIAQANGTSTSFGSGTGASNVQSIDWTVARNLTICGKLNDVGETMTLEGYTIYWVQ